ncbi:glutamate--tRNA ligase [Pseudenhygromyxa sp. WMMC2535]|uniref:glutamate--tRNA ligase n=1 Tax=Pseudenhygromyxa sp. WMMC2535 TaxID=2712867 RepID=UPI001552C122|nr:glutamate--tRNA ligase [Pseudenhygromyxa sp. WMMC2535]NVB42654.1 glutamate--tRNA ligase [Pseudenhygromyxa sp. WMMC2535]
MTSEGAKSPKSGDLGRMPPRVRIAPSPTGDPHVGTAYIGLFNYVFARKHGGKFILRIEDTDRQRSTESSERAILAALRWLGLGWDEGPDVGGPHGPYRQSERLDLYKRQVQALLDAGHAYRCFCTRERLDDLRKQQEASKASRYGYDRHCRDLDPAEAQARADQGVPHVIRLKMPLTGTVTIPDGLRGNITRDYGESDDQVLLKTDGFPTYHLANVIDDHFMGITHVIRGEEWISSTPKHLVLYEAFGWEAPRFYHLGLLRNPDGSKLSKRKNPVSVDYYRELGFLPETLLNYLGTMGFSISGDRDRFTLDEMIAAFSWDRVSTGGPVFDPVKLRAFNKHDLQALPIDELYSRVQARVFSEDRIRALLALAQPRIELLDDLVPWAHYFFGGSLDYAPVLDKFRIKKRSRAEVMGILKMFLESIERDDRAREFSAQGLEAFTLEFGDQHGWKKRELWPLLRLSATAQKATPDLFATLSLLGKDRFRQRVRDAIATLKAGENW